MRRRGPPRTYRIAAAACGPALELQAPRFCPRAAQPRTPERPACAYARPTPPRRPPRHRRPPASRRARAPAGAAARGPEPRAQARPAAGVPHPGLRRRPALSGGLLVSAVEGRESQGAAVWPEPCKAALASLHFTTSTSTEPARGLAGWPPSHGRSAPSASGLCRAAMRQASGPSCTPVAPAPPASRPPRLTAAVPPVPPLPAPQPADPHLPPAPARSRAASGRHPAALLPAVSALRARACGPPPRLPGLPSKAWPAHARAPCRRCGRFQLLHEFDGNKR